MTKQLRFGVVTPNGATSPYFTVRTSRRGDVYAACAAMGRAFHISLHESREHWHVKVNTPQGEQRLPIRAHDHDEATTRALTLNVPSATAVLPKPDKKVTWIPTDESDGLPSTAFRFLIQLPENGAILDWPARGVRGVTLVGRLPIADFGTLTVTAMPRDLPPPTTFELIVDGDPAEIQQRLVADFQPDSLVLLVLDVPNDPGTELILASGAMFKLPDDLSGTC